jgi:hypothetical protein
MHVDAALEPFCEIGADLVCSYLRVISKASDLIQVDGGSGTNCVRCGQVASHRRLNGSF